MDIKDHMARSQGSQVLSGHLLVPDLLKEALSAVNSGGPFQGSH